MERFERVTLGPLYSVRLEDLSRAHRLEATCGRCDRRTIIDPALLKVELPGYTRIMDLEKKLKCCGCGNRDYNTLRVGRLTRD